MSKINKNKNKQQQRIPDTATNKKQKNKTNK